VVLINTIAIHYDDYCLFNTHYFSFYIANRLFNSENHRTYPLAANCHHDFVDNYRNRTFRINYTTTSQCSPMMMLPIAGVFLIAITSPITFIISYIIYLIKTKNDRKLQPPIIG